MKRRVVLTIAILSAALLVARAGVDVAFAEEPVVLIAGDIARCGSQGAVESGAMATASLLESLPGTVFTAGDNVYPDGTAADFQNCYGPTWGRLKPRTFAAAGNHDYHQANASAYYSYFGANAGPAGKGYYSLNLGAWHIIVLNSNIATAAGSEQERWLRADLASSLSVCTLAIWHHPLFGSGHHGDNGMVRDLWRALYDDGTDVVVNAHDHDYERFAPQNPTGARDSTRGIREFIVGTGGADLDEFRKIQPNSEVRNNKTHGVLKLTLHPTSYDWEFVPVAGSAFTDKGAALCVN